MKTGQKDLWTSCYSSILSFALWAYLMGQQSVTPMALQNNSTKCNVSNKNPCEIFPELCSPGGGLCIVKAPCEYQCVCPPDGRISRDCTSNTTLEHGNLVDSLFVSAKDILWDINSIKTAADFAKRIAQVTTEGTSTIHPTVKATTVNINEKTMQVTDRNSPETLTSK